MVKRKQINKDVADNGGVDIDAVIKEIEDGDNDIEDDIKDEVKDKVKDKVKEDIKEEAKQEIETVCSGLPMTVQQMQEYLVERNGVPTVLRKVGVPSVTCPYSGKTVEIPPGTSYWKPDWMDTADDYQGIVIGERVFVPSYGFRIYEYKQEKNINTLIDH